MGTYTLPSQRKNTGSGTQKLKTFKEKAKKSSKPTETPSQYRERVFENSEPVTDPTPTPTREPVKITPAKNVSYVPTPVKDVDAWQASQKQVEFKETTAPVTLPTPLKAIQERYEEPKGVTQEQITAKTEEKLSTAQKEAAAATQDYEMSGFSRGFYNRAAGIAETVRQAAPITQATFVGIPVLSQATPFAAESVARLTEFGGMLPGGFETMVRRPDVIKPAFTTAIIGVPKGFATQVIEEPVQLVSDIATGTLLGFGATKAVKPISAKIPAVELKSTVQEPLVKITVPEVKPTPTKPTMVKQAELIEVFGIDVYKLSDVPVTKFTTEPATTALTQKMGVSDVSTITYGQLPTKQPTIPAFVGETKLGTTELFFKADQPTIKALGKEYFGEVTQFKTSEGKSYFAFEPTAQRPIEPITKPPKMKQFPEPSDYITIGEVPTTKKYDVSLPGFRVIKKKAITPVDVEFGKTVTKEADIFETTAREQFKLKAGRQPIAKIGDFETFETDIIQIGKRYDVTKQQEQFQAFIESTEAQVSPKVMAKRKAAQQQLITKTKTETKPQLIEEELVAQFERDQAAFMKEEAELFKPTTLTKVETAQLERPATQNIFRSDIEAILARQATQKITPQFKTITGIKKKPIQKPITKPFPVTVIKPAMSFKPETGQIFEQQPEQIPAFDFSRYPIQAPIQEPIFKQVVETQYKPPTPTKTKAVVDVDFKIPEIVKPKRRTEKKKRKQKKLQITKEAEFTELVNPLRGFRDVFGF